MRVSTIALLVLVAAVFGCLMAARDQVDSTWLRALMAAIAAGSFVAAVIWIQRRRLKN
jgi:formate/nitrite transporter FocA (FNT family)